MPRNIPLRFAAGNCVAKSYIRFKSSNSSVWDKYHLSITKGELYPEDGDYIEELVDEMNGSPIVNISQKAGGTQLKLVVEFPSQRYALFKPMRSFDMTKILKADIDIALWKKIILKDQMRWEEMR
ncbi:hypothetical protein QYM36_009143 [Artemia franciscana]|uniref:Uncharacterized protein n=1 Tax=Artemia franciscana TaxID=6661 RepID=A0AA88L344_ARTSF|nr:hypothetical protein QYM36_009143 [Artemia franciscana]